ITITGVAQDAVSIQGNNGTTVNLGGGPADYANVVNIVINMNNGDDIVTATNLALSGKLTFNGGAGNDSLTLDGTIGANVIGALTYSGGDGNDVLTFQNGPNQVNGLLA